MTSADPSSMRVAMLGPISWRTPPRHYGPWELFVSMLTEGLVERGVDVTLFATADSITKARLIATVDRATRKIQTSSRALLHLIKFDEPFGLSVIEAMACGTPVIAVKRGSMPELIEHGIDGFLVDGIDAAVESVAAASSLDRHRVRRTIGDRFTHERMVDDYITVYQRAVELRATGRRCR